MRLLLAIPAVSLALLGAQPLALADTHTAAITSSEAAAALAAQIHRRTAARLRGGYSSNTSCSGQIAGGQTLSPTTRLARWRCKLELSGARFPSACKAEAYVSATHGGHRVRVPLLAVSRYCRDQ